MRFLILYIALLTGLSGTVLASNGDTPSADKPTAASQLQQLLQPIKSLQGGFSQSQRGQDGKLMAELNQQGQLQVTRAGQMRWIVSGEYGQQVVTNGETLWLYDPDLERVTIQPFDAAGQDSPALLLMGDVERLTDSYRIEEGADKDSYILQPQQDNSSYQHITITFENQLPKFIAVLDSLGELTQIEFQQLVLNPQLPASLFEFQPPEDVDLIYN